jgi:YD repeat-containing protein
MTEEDSPVSGVTSHGYDEHGTLTSTTDARPVTVTRSYDAADRLTFVDYPDPALDTSYTYDDTAVPFSKGRLTAISRDGLSVDYEYDRFGRTMRDGKLTYAYDKNGNPRDPSLQLVEAFPATTIRQTDIPASKQPGSAVSSARRPISIRIRRILARDSRQHAPRT